MCYRLPGERSNGVDSELVGVRAEESAEEPPPPSENNPCVSQDPSLFVTDVLRTNLLCIFYTMLRDLRCSKESPLIALEQPLLQTLDAFFKEPCACSIADFLPMCVCSLDSSLQLTVLCVSFLPLPGCSSCGHRHIKLCYCLDITPAMAVSALLRRLNQLCCLRYGCCVDNLHINFATALGYRPEVVSHYCCYLLAHTGIIRQPRGLFVLLTSCFDKDKDKDDRMRVK